MHPVIEDKEYTIARLNRERLKDMEALYRAVYGNAAIKNYFCLFPTWNVRVMLKPNCTSPLFILPSV